MAINFKGDGNYGYSLLPLFGVSGLLIAKAKKCGVAVEQSSPGTFLVKHQDFVYGSVSVKGSAITLAKAGTLGPASKGALTAQFEAAMEKAIEASAASNTPDPVPNNDELEEFPLKVTKITLPKPKSSGGAIWPDGVEAFDFNGDKSTKIIGVDMGTETGSFGTPYLKKVAPSKSYVDSLKPMQLANAKAVYCPVTGTSSGSVYYVLAIWEGLNLAVRLKNTKASFRAEGGSLAEYKSQLEELGFKVNGNYASVHYQMPDLGLTLKTVGAIIGRIGFGGLKDYADPEVIVGWN